MKLKGLKNRAYNILFHTHTVAGIVISFALFVIFYAGSYALFRHEIYRWENPNARFETPTTINLDHVLERVRANKVLFAETEQFSISPPNEEMPFIQFFGAAYKDESKTETERFKGLINTQKDYEYFDLAEPQTTVGDTIYHLHYFGQIPTIGLYLSGLVALFFLFATVTGILIHWRNLITKFYAFTMQGKWKQIWTNSHTVLGVIGLPFQVIYAITGALFGLLTLLLLPSAFILFGGDTDKVLATVRPESAIKISKDAASIEHPSIQHYYEQALALYPGINLRSIRALNHGKEDGYISFYLDDGHTINGTGQITYALKSSGVLIHTDPKSKTYTSSVLNTMTRLHFASFGGMLMKIAYFILGMLTCFMLLSGVLLWQEARNNKRYTAKQKQFHHRVTKVYLAICLGLFPATALIFIANKAVPIDLIGRTAYVNTVFFTGWLLLIIAGLFWNDFRKLNKNYLLIGGVLSLLVPVANGIVTGDWLWHTLANADWYVASVDVAWLLTGLAAFGIVALIPNQYNDLNKMEKTMEVNTKSEVLAPAEMAQSPVYFAKLLSYFGK